MLPKPSWSSWIWGGLVSTMAVWQAIATPIVGDETGMVIDPATSRVVQAEPLNQVAADDADYWTILLLASIEDRPGDPLVAIREFLGSIRQQASRLLLGWRHGQQEGAVDPDDGEFDDEGPTRHLLRHFRFSDDPLIDDSRGFEPDDSRVLLDWGGDSADVKRGAGQEGVVPLSRLFLREDQARLGWLGGGNRFLTGPIERRHGTSMHTSSLQGGGDIGGSLSDVSEWVDAILHYRPGPRAWITLLLLVVLVVLLRIRHIRRN